MAYIIIWFIITGFVLYLMLVILCIYKIVKIIKLYNRRGRK